MKKRILSYLLTAIMILTMMPVTAYAGGNSFKAVYDTTDGKNVLTFYYDGSAHTGENKTVYSGDKLPTAATAANSWGYDAVRANVKSVVIDESVKNYTGLRSTAFMFYHMVNADDISGAEYLDVSNVTNMTSMFSGFGLSITNLNFVPDVSEWKTSKVTSFSSMFNAYGNGSSALTEVPDVSKWITSSATDFSYIFSSYGAASTVLNNVPDVSKWDTSNATSFERIFYSYGKKSTVLNKTPNLSNWNTANVTNVSCLFEYYADSSTEIEFFLDLSGWDLSKALQNKASGALNMAARNGKSWTVSIPLYTGTKANIPSDWFTGPNGVNDIIKPLTEFKLPLLINNGAPETAATENNGYITINRTSALEGSTVTITAVPNEGYSLKADSLKATYNDGEEKSCKLTQDTTDETKYTFTMPGYEVTVTAEFEEIPSEIKVTASSEKTTYLVGESIIVKGTVMDGNNPVANVKVDFVANGELISLTTNSEGCCQVHFDSLPADSYVIKVSYEKGSDKYEDEVIVTVKEQNPEPDIKFTASSDKDTYLEGELITLTATVLDGNTPVDKELVVFSVNGRTITVQTINGSCSISTSLPAGSYTISACYEKDGDQYKDVVEVTVMKKPNENHIVKFDLNNGKTDGPAPQEIKHGEKATKPADPSDEGWIFEGWYSDAELTKEYDFSAPIMADIKVFAKWTEDKLPTPPEPAPEPDEVYYAPLIADLKANEEGVIEWKVGDALPLEAVMLLVDKPELSLEFTFTYEGEEHTIYIPAGAFEKYYDVTIPWYGAAWLIQYFEKAEKEVIEYTIVPGDTLNALAEKYKCTVEEILALNPYISNKNLIYPNNKLLIPVQK